MGSDAGWSPAVPDSVDLTREDEEATASAIYGVIISAAVMAASHADSAAKLVVSVVATLTIYWGAERYARIVAERIHEGHHPNWTSVRHQLTHGWEMVTASALPLTVLAVLSALGAELYTAVISGLVCSTVLLGVAGWSMGRGSLSTKERMVSAAVAAMFGALFVLLKSLLH
jgi:hypothetical protein